MNAFRKFVIALLSVMVFSVAAYSMPKGWEPVRTEQSANAKTVMRDVELEIKANSNTIIVQSNRQIQIKIFTILGRLITSETLPPGSARYVLPVHGVYIIKVGDMTCKVAV